MSAKVIVITGASGGIGAATADLLSSRGDHVVLIARSEGPLAALAAACGPDALPIVADVTSREDVKRAVAKTITHFGHIDVWINNAGQGISRLPSELTDDDIDLMMQVNVKSALYGIQEVLPHFRARGAGHIINISSMLARVPFATIRSAYAASKSFLNSLTETLRAELRESDPGIQVSLVSPGVVATDFGRRARHGGVDSRTLPGAQSAEEVAQVIASVIDSRQPDVYTRPEAPQLVARHYAPRVPDAT